MFVEVLVLVHATGLVGVSEAVGLDVHMSPEGEDLASYLFLKAIDKRRSDDHDRYAQCYRRDSDPYDKGGERPRPAKGDLAYDKELGVQPF